uniref:GATA-type domain-containing protein n=1 Tax=Angiostrongylus cantonensis TaxID=6313 RepID=A0A158P9Z6_ANGCA
MADEGEHSRSPDQCYLRVLIALLDTGGFDSERIRSIQAYRKRADGEICCFEAHDGIIYKPGDSVYIEATPSDPYIIGSITMFKMTKRDMLSVKVTRFFRPEDVPEISLSLISQERMEMDFPEEPSPEILSRELFTSDITAFHSISSLRGKCKIAFVKDIRSLGDCDLSRENTFFSCLSFNQESSRLASVQGEIRVGASYQAKLPAEASCSVADDADRDELLYRPGMIDPCTEDKYIKLARSFRMFAMMETRMMDTEKTPTYSFQVSDLLFDDALTTLHRCGYRFDEALKEMNANDKLLSADANFMTVEDTKKFSKGIKTIGKNFVRISRELLPLHSRDQLVGFYYLWKKTSDAVKPKPLSRQRNQVTSIKRTVHLVVALRPSRTSRPASTELLDYASASEGEMEALDAEKAAQYACHHCYGSKSRDWHHAGRDGLLLCSDCRLFYKKYGQLRPVDRPSTVPPCLFKRSPSSVDAEEESGVKTRAGKKERRRFVVQFVVFGPRGIFPLSQVLESMEIPNSISPVEKVEQLAKMVEDVKPESAVISGPKREEKLFDDIDSDESDENITAIIDDDNTWKHGDQVGVMGEACSSKNAIFVQSIVRSCGQMSARTDLSYRMPSDCEWARRKREKKEKAAAVTTAQQQPVTPTQPKKVATDFNGMVPTGIADLSRVASMNGQMSVFHGMDPMTIAMMQQMQQAQLMEAQQQAAAQQQHVSF